MLIEWTLDAPLPTPADAVIIASLANTLLDQYPQIINVAPAYRTLLIQFDVLSTDPRRLRSVLEDEIEMQAQAKCGEISNITHQIPTYYDASVAADLVDLCHLKGLSTAQLVQAHTSQTYTVYAVGFQPGFAYLGYVPAMLATPRHRSFRGNVAAGSVGIADRQTAVYPTDSPGGWQIIGRTPLHIFDCHHSLLKAGDQVQFVSIDRVKYLSLGGTIGPVAST